MPPLTRKILLIDDDPVVREAAAMMLRDEGVFVLEASCGVEGIEMALRSPPDLVLCDLFMPGVDGFGVLARLRAEPATAGVPFVFITASTDEDDSRVGFGLGADDYLHKPLDGDALVAVIARHFPAG
ncbi:MAG: response regulator [Betaproteobacteria bacterium]|uniref:Response regulator n=1 Tax=Candidatus Proximibacter danicus TaxID=2954365 RepID=A0A9D7PRC2_9PROT|nr:response regulator [Candidatus Proximibacter danicus]